LKFAAALLPHVVDRVSSPLRGRKLHAVDGEPGEHVFPGALQVVLLEGGGVFLEGVRVDVC